MNYSCVDFDSIYNELLKYHLGSEYYPIADKSDFYKVDQINATTLDEYLLSLIRGHINTIILTRETVNYNSKCCISLEKSCLFVLLTLEK